MKRIALTFSVGATAVLGLAFAACGGDDTAAASTTAPTSAATKPAATAKTPATSASPKASPTAAAKGTPIKLQNPTTTASGLQYVDVVVGTGASPTLDQTVTVNYTGKLAANGQVFDSTQGKQPATFAMKQVIKGFQEGLSTMKVGGKRTVYIPSALGYKDIPQGPIPANSDLVFDIELIAVK